MSCSVGDFSCDVPRRRSALIILAVMTIIFLLLSAFSFVSSRGQVTPDEITYNGYTADAGKRVFQAYNCMGCHTIVGNGAYLGPDLTDEYKHAGPAWLEAFLPSAGSWPTRGTLKVNVANSKVLAAAGIDSLDAYLDKFPGAAERVGRRGGLDTHMPNLPLTQQETGQLIAFLKYTSAMNTQGWPPQVRSGNIDQRVALAHGPGLIASAAAATPQANGMPGAAQADDNAADAGLGQAEQGEQLATNYGCLACHATNNARKVGPGWGGLYGSQVTLADGATVTADDAYLVESIREPDAAVPEGYVAGVMPTFDASIISDDEVKAIVAYLASLKDGEK